MAKNKEMKRWYGFSFRMTWPKNQEPKTWIDIFIIDTIVRDVISEKNSALKLWRIHRRWVRDGHGHELTIDCFTDKETSSFIKELIRENDSFKILKDNNLLADDLLKHSGGSNIHDIADNIWPMELKKSWPYYIQGSSKLFLYLIEFIKGGIKANFDEKDVSKIEFFYTEINNRINGMWQQHGSHAFFHHINAIFGYMPILAKPRGFHGILTSF